MNPSCPALGWRPMDAEGKAGDYEWITYSELESEQPSQTMRAPALSLSLVVRR